MALTKQTKLRASQVQSKDFNTEADAKSYDKVSTLLGSLVYLEDRDALFKVVLSSSVTPNGKDIIQSTVSPSFSYHLRYKGEITLRSLGCSIDGSSDATPFIERAHTIGHVAKVLSDETIALITSPSTFTGGKKLLGEGDSSKVILFSDVPLTGFRNTIDKLNIVDSGLGGGSVITSGYGQHWITFNKFDDLKNPLVCDYSSSSDAVGENYILYNNFNIQDVSNSMALLIKSTDNYIQGNIIRGYDWGLVNLGGGTHIYDNHIYKYPSTTTSYGMILVGIEAQVERNRVTSYSIACYAFWSFSGSRGIKMKGNFGGGQVFSSSGILSFKPAQRIELSSNYTGDVLYRVTGDISGYVSLVDSSDSSVIYVADRSAPAQVNDVLTIDGVNYTVVSVESPRLLDMTITGNNFSHKVTGGTTYTVDPDIDWSNSSQVTIDDNTFENLPTVSTKRVRKINWTTGSNTTSTAFQSLLFGTAGSYQVTSMGANVDFDLTYDNSVKRVTVTRVSSEVTPYPTVDVPLRVEIQSSCSSSDEDFITPL